MAKNKKISRLARLGALTYRVSSCYIGQRIKSSFSSEEDNVRELKALHVENAQRIVGVMKNLKGAAMKVGQSLAVMSDSIDLPEEISTVLSQLHDRADPVPFKDILSVINDEIGDPFLQIDPEPLGTASLAQVHGAWLKDGTAVVVKVLHDGVEQSVDTDLLALKSILLAGRFLNRSRAEVETIFEEIRDRLLEELDYEQEAKHLELFYRIFRDFEHIETPKPYKELSTKRVLVMQRLVGRNLKDFISSASPEAMQRAGDSLSTAFHEMTYIHRSLHADPHGGNFLFGSNGGLKLIDFGCIKRFSTDFIADYGRLTNAIIASDREKTLELACKIGILNEASVEAEEAFWRFSQVAAEPFWVDTYNAGGHQDKLVFKLKSVSKDLLRYSEVRSPKDLIFLHRALLGTYSMLRVLKHQGQYEHIRSSYVEHAIQVHEGVIPDRSGFNSVLV